MTLVVKPSVDWTRRTTPLDGTEDLLKQNPIEDVAPQEERIQTSLIADYTLFTHPFEIPDGFYTGDTLVNHLSYVATIITTLEVSGAVTTFTDNLDGTYTFNNGVGGILTVNTNANTSYIVDSGGYYTGTTVEEALNQIGENLTPLLELNIEEKVSNYVLTDTNDVILANASGSSIDITLHNNAKKKRYVIKAVDFTNAITLTPSSGTIDGNGSYAFSALNQSITVIPNNGNWYII